MFTTQRTLLTTGVGLALLAGAVGCNQGARAEAARDTNKDGVVDTMPAEKSNDWTDTRILRAVQAANTADSTVAAYARSAAQSPGVKEYAQLMMREHGIANRELAAMAGRINLPYDSSHVGEDDPRMHVMEKGRATMEDLRKHTGLEFDKEYVEEEIELHEHVLKEIEKDLMPNAQHPEIRAFLEKVRPAVAAHLERAKGLQEELKRGALPR